MAKESKPLTSLLAASYAAFEAGDMVVARRLAKQVLAGKGGKEEEQAAKKLAKDLAQDTPVGEKPADVAAVMVERTMPPPKPFLLALASAAVLLLLLLLARLRY